MVARLMNGRYVRLKPSDDLNSFLIADRVVSTLAKSTSTTLKACGLTDLLMIMCWPVSLRIFDSLTVASRSPPPRPASVRPA